MTRRKSERTPSPLPSAEVTRAWCEDLVTAASAWRSGAFARAASFDLGLDAPNGAALRVEALCTYAGRLSSLHSERAFGRALWYLMGSGRQVWSRVARAEGALAARAVLSLRSLYEGVFARLDFAADGSRDAEGELETACYMLWDMDGGLQPPSGRDERLDGPKLATLDYALRLESPACWYSALHGLGHAGGASRARALIDAFVRHGGAALNPFLRAYAERARDGVVQ
jgi:hypothetical protein